MTAPRLVPAGQPDDWRCHCDDHPQPHVHCPYQGGHLHIVDDDGNDITTEDP